MAHGDPPRPMIDGFGRRIDYVRLSVTDRCDLRCTYCMPARMTFLPRADLLTIEELGEIADALVARGVKRIRLTGGEPLVRRGVLDLVAHVGRHVGAGLSELTMTTNGMALAAAAPALAAAGMRRVNVSLDSLDADRFRRITRGGDLARAIAGIDAARAAGLAVRVNMVALKGENLDEIAPMLRWCGARGLDLCLIETMPLGTIDERRADRFAGLDEVRRGLGESFTLTPIAERTAGPARYVRVAETGGRLGFITPLSDNFCASCNRIRITATGDIYGCLGDEGRVALRDAMREGGAPALHAALDRAVAGKAARHRFDIAAPAPATARHMSVTGG